MYAKQQNERQKILLSGQFQSPKAQHHRKTKNTTVGTGSKIQKNKMIERGKIETCNYIHDRSFSWFGKATSISSGGVKLVLWVHTYILSKWRYLMVKSDMIFDQMG